MTTIYRRPYWYSCGVEVRYWKNSILPRSDVCTAQCPSLISTPSPTGPFLCAPKSKLVPLALNWTIMVDGIQSEVLQYTDLYVTNMECLSLIAEGDLTRLELNNLDRWEMLVFSGCLLNQCCTNYDFNIRMYIWNKCLKVSVMSLKDGFDAHMYSGMFLNELTHANVVCVTLKNIQDELCSVKSSNSQNWYPVKCIVFVLL